MKKKLYFGQFNWYGEIFKIWKYAINEFNAWFLMVREISIKTGASRYRIRQHFNGTRDNYKIERRQEKDTILSGATLENIVFPKKHSKREKTKSKRRFSDARRDE